MIAATRVHDHTGYFSPVYSADGQFVYYVARQTRGLVTGFGWESISPPAHVFVWRDRFELHRLDLDTRDVEVLAALPPTPIEDRRIRTYRGRAFTLPFTMLQWVEGSRREIRIRLSIPLQPTSEQHFLTTVWDSTAGAVVQNAAWTAEFLALSGDDVSPLFENWEVLAVSGPESFPCALVAHDATTDEVRVLAQQLACEAPYESGVSAEDFTGLTRRADLERIRDLSDTQARLTREAIESGMAEQEAALRVVDQMTELGYYARSPYLVARALDLQEVETERTAGRLRPLFVIEEMQFIVGLFQDLERAIDAPTRH